MKVLAQVVLCGLLASVPGAACAATIGDFQFSGKSLASSDPGTSWSTGPISAGPGIPLSFDDETSPTGTGNPAPALGIRFDDIIAQGSGPQDLASAITRGDYYSFTVTPDSLTQISFTDFTFDVVKTGGAEFTAVLMSDADGFTAGSELDSQAWTATTFQTFTLDASSLTNISSPVEFRLYYVPTANFTTGSNRLNTDNILLEGTATVVPEPGTLAISLLGIIGLGIISRRTR